MRFVIGVSKYCRTTCKATAVNRNPTSIVFSFVALKNCSCISSITVSACSAAAAILLKRTETSSKLLYRLSLFCAIVFNLNSKSSRLSILSFLLLYSATLYISSIPYNFIISIPQIAQKIILIFSSLPPHSILYRVSFSIVFSLDRRCPFAEKSKIFIKNAPAGFSPAGAVRFMGIYFSFSSWTLRGVRRTSWTRRLVARVTVPSKSPQMNLSPTLGRRLSFS